MRGKSASEKRKAGSAARIGIILVRGTASAPGQEQRGHAEAGEQQQREGDQNPDKLHGYHRVLRVLMGGGADLGG